MKAPKMKMPPGMGPDMMHRSEKKAEMPKVPAKPGRPQKAVSGMKGFKPKSLDDLKNLYKKKFGG